jgi:hypothetical protein
VIGRNMNTNISATAAAAAQKQNQLSPQMRDNAAVLKQQQ